VNLREKRGKKVNNCISNSTIQAVKFELKLENYKISK